MSPMNFSLHFSVSAKMGGGHHGDPQEGDQSKGSPTFDHMTFLFCSSSLRSEELGSTHPPTMCSPSTVVDPEALNPVGLKGRGRAPPH